MPFADPEVRRSYLAGYHSGYKLDITISVAKARRAAVPPYVKPKYNEAWLKGFNTGLSNRKGEAERERKRTWYHDNQERVTAELRRQRRQAAAADAMQAVKALEKSQKVEGKADS